MYYTIHNIEVRTAVPKERPLEFSFKVIWRRLCEFLEVLMHDEPLYNPGLELDGKPFSNRRLTISTFPDITAYIGAVCPPIWKRLFVQVLSVYS